MNVNAVVLGPAQAIVLIKAQGFGLSTTFDALQMIMSVVAVLGDVIAISIGDLHQSALAVVMQGLPGFIAHKVAVIVVFKLTSRRIVWMTVSDFD